MGERERERESVCVCVWVYECEWDLFFRKNNFHNSDGTGAVSHIFMKGVYNCYTYMIAYQAKTMGHKVAFFWFIFFSIS